MDETLTNPVVSLWGIATCSLNHLRTVTHHGHNMSHYRVEVLQLRGDSPFVIKCLMWPHI